MKRSPSLLLSLCLTLGMLSTAAQATEWHNPIDSAAVARGVDNIHGRGFCLNNYTRLPESAHGIIRDAETLEWLSAAPIYDSGSSLGYDVPTDEISSESITSCTPFSNTFRKQIRLASSLESVDLDGMRRALPEVEDVYRTGPKRLDDDRVDAISRLILDRIDEVEARRDAMRGWHRPCNRKTV